MSTASNIEREMLALINQERTSRGLNPLQLETRLNASSEDHSEWMLDTDIFSHTGSGGSSATQRMEDAGFDLSGSWRTGENIAWQSERGAPGVSDDVAQLHQNLMNSPGHRANILNPDYEYIGIGIETGDMQGFDAVMVTQNFATTDGTVVLDSGATPMPVVPDVPDTPDDADLPDDPDTPDTPDIVDGPDADDTPDEPDAPDMPDTPDVGEDPDTPTEPDTPDVAEDPDTPAEPETPDTPDDPDIVEQPDAPDPTTDEVFDVDAFLAAVEQFVNQILSLVDEFEWIDIELPDAQPDADGMDDDDLLLLPDPDADDAPADPVIPFEDDDDMVFTPIGHDCMFDAA